MLIEWSKGTSQLNVECIARYTYINRLIPLVMAPEPGINVGVEDPKVRDWHDSDLSQGNGMVTDDQFAGYASWKVDGDGVLKVFIRLGRYP